MAQSINKTILIGNLTRDPEVRALSDGDKVLNLGIATNETWNDRASGERKSKTEYHNVVVFNQNLIPVIEKYAKKGTRVYVEGSIASRSYKDRDDNERTVYEIVLARFRGEFMLLDGQGRQSDGEAETTPTPADAGTGSQIAADKTPFDTSDIPF